MNGGFIKELINAILEVDEVSLYSYSILWYGIMDRPDDYVRNGHKAKNNLFPVFWAKINEKSNN